MPKYSYLAINQMGHTIEGFIEADSVELATNVLVTRGYIPSRVSADGAAGTRLSWSGVREKLTPVKPPDLILFTKQFRTLLKAGVPVLQALQILEHQTENLRLKRIAASMAQDITEGATLTSAFRKHPKVFSPLYCAMVRAGEASGAIVEVLERLTYIIEHEHKLRSDVRTALQYPVTVVVALCIAFVVLLNFVIPKFVQIFKNAKIELPLPTLICIRLHEFMAHYWHLILLLTMGLLFGLGYYLKTAQGKYVKDCFLLRLPIFGKLLIKVAMSRFASIFAILQSTGVPVLDALAILTGTIGNSAIAREFDRIRDRVEEGRGIAAPLKKAGYFTPMVINMVAIGEESGNLDGMLREISAHYDDEIAYSVRTLSDAIGPILIVALAVVVGFFALAIFLPMWDLTKMVTR